MINQQLVHINSFPASSDFFHLLIMFTNSLYQDQDQQNIGPGVDPNCLAHEEMMFWPVVKDII